MELTIRKYSSFEEMKADEYRYWQSRPVHERIDAAEEMIRTAYALTAYPTIRYLTPWALKADKRSAARSSRMLSRVEGVLDMDDRPQGFFLFRGTTLSQLSLLPADHKTWQT